MGRRVSSVSEMEPVLCGIRASHVATAIGVSFEKSHFLDLAKAVLEGIVGSAEDVCCSFEIDLKTISIDLERVDW
jgi:hypothetical protein